MNIRDLLIDNERKAGDAYRLATGNGLYTKRVAFFSRLTHDGDLIAYINDATQTKLVKDRDAWYLDHGFETPRSIIAKHFSELDVNDKLDIHSFRIGDTITKSEISAIAKCFNDQRGMYPCGEDSFNPYIILASNNGKGMYEDHWIDEGTSFLYYMQNENSTDGVSFRHSGNIMLFNDYIRSGIGDIPRLPIYLFGRSGSGDSLDFCGVFYANRLIGRNSFEIVRNDLVLGQRFVEEKADCFNDFLRRKPDALVGGRTLQESAFEPTKQAAGRHIDDSSRFVSREDESHDFFSDDVMRKKIGDLGEEIALDYERRRVALIAPSKAKDVQLAADWLGYDMRTFERVGNQVHEIKLEVKTTVEANPYCPFFMSINEKRVMEQYPQTYWLYRLYSVTSSCPRFFAIKGNVASKLRLDSQAFSCSFNV